MPGIRKQRRVKTKGACRKCFKWHKDARLEQAYWNVTSTNTTINPFPRPNHLTTKSNRPHILSGSCSAHEDVLQSRANYSSTTSWQLFWRPLWGPSNPSRSHNVCSFIVGCWTHFFGLLCDWVAQRMRKCCKSLWLHCLPLLWRALLLFPSRFLLLRWCIILNAHLEFSY